MVSKKVVMALPFVFLFSSLSGCGEGDANLAQSLETLLLEKVNNDKYLGASDLEVEGLIMKCVANDLASNHEAEARTLSKMTANNLTEHSNPQEHKLLAASKSVCKMNIKHSLVNLPSIDLLEKKYALSVINDSIKHKVSLTTLASNNYLINNDIYNFRLLLTLNESDDVENLLGVVFKFNSNSKDWDQPKVVKLAESSGGWRGLGLIKKQYLPIFSNELGIVWGVSSTETAQGYSSTFEQLFMFDFSSISWKNLGNFTVETDNLGVVADEKDPNYYSYKANLTFDTVTTSGGLPNIVLHKVGTESVDGKVLQAKDEVFSYQFDKYVRNKIK